MSNLLEQAANPQEPSYRTIPLRPVKKGKFALVDAEDYEYLDRWNWYLIRARKFEDREYAARVQWTDGIPMRILMHRVVMKANGNGQMDHVNRNGLDNRKCNLRFCTPSQNMMNRRVYKNSNTGFKGVKKQGKRWIARITFEKQSFHLGTFNSPEEAGRAYDRKALELAGPFAKLNFPHTGTPEALTH